MDLVSRLLVPVILSAFVSLLSAEVGFSDLDLSPGDELLFAATAGVPGADEYRALFHADLSSVPDRTPAAGLAGGDVLSDVTITAMTHYPENLTYLSALQSVQIQNRFGLFRGDVDSGVLVPVVGFDGFTTGAEVPVGRIFPVTASPDGRYLLVIEQTSAAYGDLVLLATDLGSRGPGRTTIASRIELSTEQEPARWSPDSRFFVYSRGGGVFYFSIDQHERGRSLDESYRELGPGTISSVRWSSRSSLFYVSGSLVYEIRGPEFFTRSLYAGLLPAGTIVGKLPAPFDSSFDTFHMGPDGSAVLLNKGGRNLFLLFLSPEDYVDDGRIVGLPSLLLPRNTRVRDVAWSDAGQVTVLTTSLVEGAEHATLFRLNVRANEEQLTFTRTDDQGVHAIRLAPDERLIALLTAEGVRFRDYATWAVARELAIDEPMHAVWLDSQRLLVGSRATIDVVEPHSGRTRFVTLSQADDHSIDDAGRVFARSSGRAYVYDGRWVPSGTEPAPRKRVTSARFRVFLEILSAGSYRSIVMVRRVTDAGTSRLFPPPERAYEPFPDEDEPVDFAYFTHGSRIRRREIAFVFDAIDSVEGLTEILTTLAGYQLQATFFVNGEFIRRHPAALTEILGAGHEVGSLFFAHFDMSDRRFRVTPQFVSEGLARNEDEFFQATGRELSLIWHAPYYHVSDDIIAGGEQANYLYVGRDVDSLDWVPKRTDEGLSRLYMPASDLVERIVELKEPGSIVSMQTGVPDEARGGRDDYLFQRLDVLINALIGRGYDIVPVSTLIEHAR